MKLTNYSPGSSNLDVAAECRSHAATLHLQERRNGERLTLQDLTPHLSMLVVAQCCMREGQVTVQRIAGSKERADESPETILILTRLRQERMTCTNLCRPAQLSYPLTKSEVLVCDGIHFRIFVFVFILHCKRWVFSTLYSIRSPSLMSSLKVCVSPI